MTKDEEATTPSEEPRSPLTELAEEARREVRRHQLQRALQRAARTLEDEEPPAEDGDADPNRPARDR